MKNTKKLLISLISTLACALAFAQASDAEKAAKEQAKKEAEAQRIEAKNVWQAKFKKGAAEDQTMLLNLSKEPNLKAGFKSIFDGKTLKGWKVAGGTATFEVKDGEIIASKNPEDDIVQINTYLITEKNYKNFILTLEYRWIELGNSGVNIHSRMKHEVSKTGFESDRVCGPQIEIETSKDRCWTGGIYSERAGGGWKYSLSREDHENARQAVKDQKDWNRLTIECKDGVVKTWVNGVPCANFDMANDKDFKSFDDGFIGLQVHHGKTGVTAFKNIKIKEL